MILTERHIIKKSNSMYGELDNLCFLSKNIYNSALYSVRQYYFENKKYLNWVNVNNNFVRDKQVDYYAMPCKVSQQTLKMVDNNMKSFFNAIKAKNSKPRLPKYLDKTKGRYVAIYTNQAISKKELEKGFIALSKTNVRIKTKVTNVKQVRVVPRNNHIVVEVLYEATFDNNVSTDTKYCGIDFGLNNLMTCAFQDERPLIFNGRPLKSINWRYNKEWKQGISIGKVNNQNFVGIPYYKLLNMLSYKCEMHGISFSITEESYTSKCSFLDNEVLCKHDTYLGRRVHRGLFRASSGRTINADVNGALNILKKVIGNYEYDPIKVCSTPLVIEPKN